MSGSESNITCTDTVGLIISGGSGPATGGRGLQNYCVPAATAKLCAKAGHRNLPGIRRDVPSTTRISPSGPSWRQCAPGPAATGSLTVRDSSSWILHYTRYTMRVICPSARMVAGPPPHLWPGRRLNYRVGGAPQRTAPAPEALGLRQLQHSPTRVSLTDCGAHDMSPGACPRSCLPKRQRIMAPCATHE